MNRRERRRRGERNNHPPVLVVGDGIVASSTGRKVRATPGAELSPKVAGVHRWVATGAWVLSEDEAALGATGDTAPDMMPMLDNGNLMFLGIGCWDCEEPMQKTGPGSVCPVPVDKCDD